MALPRIGSDELLYIETEKLSLTIKGKHGHPKLQELAGDQLADLIINCRDLYGIINVSGQNVDDVQQNGKSYTAVVKTTPMFYEQSNYHLTISARDNVGVAFQHENYNIRQAVTVTGRDKSILSGIVNFGNDIGYSDLVVLVDKKEYLRVKLEVFPSKISYKEDYEAIVADVTAEVYNLVFDLLKKTYLSYKQNDTRKSSPVEFFSVINKIYDDFIKATDIILAKPHHQLIANREVLPQHKIKHTDMRTLRWIEKHGEQAIRNGSKVYVKRAEAVRKQVTYDTRENRFTKYILESTQKQLKAFKDKFRMIARDESKLDPQVLVKLDSMLRGINRRCNTNFMKDINAIPETVGMSLVFNMAPGYRELYKHYLMLLHGLRITGNVFNISIKDLAVLYEYWCFIKLNSLMKDRYKLINQSIINVTNKGIRVDLVKGRESKVVYAVPNKGVNTDGKEEKIILSYNPSYRELPTVTQKPDNVLTLEKNASDIQYQYVFDAKYRINPAEEGTYYYQNFGKVPGPQEDDINTMHRYRDAIVFNNQKNYSRQRTMFGAYVLFPYADEENYKNNTFYKSIAEVNIGGLPFLPSATGLVKDFLDELIADSPESAFERAILPKGIEAKLRKVDWSLKDVLVTTVKDKEDLELYRSGKYIYVPAESIKKEKWDFRYIAIYQPTATYSQEEAGITYYGEILKYSFVSKSKTGIFKDKLKSKSEFIIKFEIEEWKKLSKKIAVKEMRVDNKFTNHFLLTHSKEIPELWIGSEEEFRFYYELKRAVNEIVINDEDDTINFKHNDFDIRFSDGKIIISKENELVREKDIVDFAKKPNKVFKELYNLVSK